MKKLISLDAAILDGKKQVAGELDLFVDHCIFHGGVISKELRWNEIQTLHYEEREIVVQSFLFKKKCTALCLSTSSNELVLIIDSNGIKLATRILQEEQIRVQKQRDDCKNQGISAMQDQAKKIDSSVITSRESAEHASTTMIPPMVVADSIKDALVEETNCKIDPIQHTNMFTVDGIELSQEQAQAYRLAEGTNLNLYVTGKAGTGKSVVLRYFRKHTNKRVAVLAPTGVAAINVDGQTIHSFFHLKPELLVDFDVSQIKGFDKLADKIRFFNTIVIDEISMVRADVLDAIDVILRKVHKNEGVPFGGCQMIFFGDLYQLPPVVTNKDRKLFASKYETSFFFGSKSVNYNTFNLIELTQVFRQKDGAFIETLNMIREGEASEETLRLLNNRVNVEMPKEHCIILTLIRSTARKINADNLQKLPGPSQIYEAEIQGDFFAREEQDDDHEPPVERNLELRVGAKIIMMVNDKERRWVNGTMGTIEELHPNEIKVRIKDRTYSINKYTWSKYRYEYNRVSKQLIQYEIASFTQYPIALAYAITIHKSQGQTYDRVKIDFADRNAFAEGQTYVALSRCKSLDGLYLMKDIERKDIIVSQEVKRWMNEFAAVMKNRILPSFGEPFPVEAAEHDEIAIEHIPEKPFEWTNDGRIKTNVPMAPKKMTGTRFAQILVPGRFNSPFEAWCEIMRVYEKPFEENKYTRAGEAIQPIQTEYVQQDECTLEVADPQAVYGENPETQTNYDFFPHDDLFGGMWDAVGRTKDGTIEKVYEMKTTGLKNANYWERERFGIPMDKLLQGALYAYLLGLSAVTMVSSYLKPEDYDAPETYVCSEQNTQKREIKLSEISHSFEEEYIEKAKRWWDTHVVTGLSPRFDLEKDQKIIEALEKIVPRTQSTASSSESSEASRMPVGMTRMIDDFIANTSSEEYYCGNDLNTHR